MQHEYGIYDDEDNLIYKYLFNNDMHYDENWNPILITNNDFTILFKKNYKNIKIVLLLHRHNRYGIGNINLEIDDDGVNYININYTDLNNLNYIKSNEENIASNLEKVDENKDNIASNLEKIDENKDDIASNLSEITYIKNNSKSYLKNVYNILYYNIKEKIIFDNNFYNKTFELNAKKLFCWDKFKNVIRM